MSAVEERTEERAAWSGVGPDKRGAYLSLPVDSISVAKNIRKVFDEEALAELAASLKEYGVLQPLVVRTLDDRDPDSRYGEAYELVAGERRLRAAKMAGLAKVPCRVVYLTAKQAAEIQLLENLQRQDLNPMEEAQALAGLMAEHGYTQEQLAQKLGKSQPWVASRTRLLALPEKACELITRGIATASHGEILTSYVKASPALVKSVAEQIEKEPVPVARLRGVIDREARKVGLPVFNGYADGKEHPLFEVGPCQNCTSMVRAKAVYGDGEVTPWCLNPSCWQKKQQEAKEASLAQASREAEKTGVLDLSGATYSSYQEFGFGRETPSGCVGCKDLKQARTYKGGSVRDVCLNPKCYRKLKVAEEKEKAQAQADAKAKAIADVMPAITAARYIDFLSVMPKRLLVLIASLVFAEVRPPSNEATAADKDLFRRLIGWTGKIERWYLSTEGYARLVEALEQMEPAVLADAVFRWLFWGKTPDKKYLPLQYLLGELAVVAPADTATEPEDDGGTVCPDDCDADCDNCDIAERLMAEDDDGDDDDEDEEEDTDDEDDDIGDMDDWDIPTPQYVQQERVPPTVYVYSSKVKDKTAAGYRFLVAQDAAGMWRVFCEKSVGDMHPISHRKPHHDRDSAQKDLDAWVLTQNGILIPEAEAVAG